MNAKEQRLIQRYAANEATKVERQQVTLLLGISKAAQKELRQHQAVLGLLRQEQERTFAPAFTGRVMQRLAHEQALASRSPLRAFLQNGRLKQVRWAVPALAVALLLALVYVQWFATTTVLAPAGATHHVTLADGSRVELNSGARLVYSDFNLRSTRRVKLFGEGFFEVAHDEKPFVVETFNATITVKGTRFNVRAWPTDTAPRTVVSLESGRVEVAARTRSRPSVTLDPGQAATVIANQPTPTTHPEIDLPHALAWRAGDYAFEDVPMGNFLDELERRFAVQIEATPQVRSQLLGYFGPQRTSVEIILEEVSYSMGLHFRRIATGYEVFADD